MRILNIVILALIIAHTDQVLSQKRGKDKKNNEGPCGRKYLRKIRNKCYYFAMKKVNWFGAQNNCLRKGLNLADLSTPEDYNAVLHYMRSKGNMEDFWFGGNDLQSEGQFTYISNGQMVRYTGTNNGGLEVTHRSNMDDCLEVRLRNNNTMITDDNCQEKQYFVCEMNGLKCATPTSTKEVQAQHSHEHLHHFHHNPAKGENAGTDKESMESDSRPADNTNSTEVGTSQENENEVTPNNNETETPTESDETNDEKTTTTTATTETTQQQTEESTPSANDNSTEVEVPTGTTTAATVESAEPVAGEATATTAATEASEGPATKGDINADTPAPDPTS